MAAEARSILLTIALIRDSNMARNALDFDTSHKLQILDNLPSYVPTSKTLHPVEIIMANKMDRSSSVTENSLVCHGRPFIKKKKKLISSSSVLHIILVKKCLAKKKTFFFTTPPPVV